LHVKLTVDAVPGELAAKLPDLIKALEQISGRATGQASGCACGNHHGELCKSSTRGPAKDTTPLFPVLQHLLEQGTHRREQIQRQMLERMNAVLFEAEGDAA
jgi:hypothetical protein